MFAVEELFSNLSNSNRNNDVSIRSGEIIFLILHLKLQQRIALQTLHLLNLYQQDQLGTSLQRYEISVFVIINVYY